MRNKKLQALVARIDGMTLRERAFVFVAALVVGFALLQLLVIDGAQLRKQIAQARLEAATSALDAIAVQRQALNDPQAVDPDKAAREMLAAQDARLTALNANLDTRERALIPPARMHAVLRDVTQRRPGIDIVGFKTLTPTPVKLPGAPEGAPPGFYRHGFQVVLSGGYTDLVGYLERLEALPWRLSWSEATLDAAGRPQLKLTLTVHTLSLEEAWLRV